MFEEGLGENAILTQSLPDEEKLGDTLNVPLSLETYSLTSKSQSLEVKDAWPVVSLVAEGTFQAIPGCFEASSALENSSQLMVTRPTICHLLALSLTLFCFRLIYL